MDLVHNALCQVADILQIKFQWDEYRLKIKSKASRTFHPSGLTFSMPLSFPSSRIFETRFLTIIHLKGKLALLLDVPVEIPSYYTMLHYLDLGATGDPENLLGTMECSDERDCMEQLFPAIVKSFYFDTAKDMWQPVSQLKENQA